MAITKIVAHQLNAPSITNGYVLTADSGQAGGMKWAAGGGGITPVIVAGGASFLTGITTSFQTVQTISLSSGFWNSATLFARLRLVVGLTGGATSSQTYTVRVTLNGTTVLAVPDTTVTVTSAIVLTTPSSVSYNLDMTPVAVSLGVPISGVGNVGAAGVVATSNPTATGVSYFTTSFTVTGTSSVVVQVKSTVNDTSASVQVQSFSLETLQP